MSTEALTTEALTAEALTAQPVAPSASRAVRPPLTVVIDGEDHPIAWSGPRDVDSPWSSVHRIRSETLADAARKRKALRAGIDDPGALVVALEVEVLVAPDASTARAAAARIGSDPDAATADVTAPDTTVRYIGTPYGLLTLVEDIYAADVADAVILTPIDGLATAALIADQVLPVLRSRRTS